MTELKHWIDTSPGIAFSVLIGLTLIYEFLIIRLFFYNSIKQVIGYIRRYFNEEFNWKYAVLVVSITATFVIAYYSSDTISNFRLSLRGSPKMILYYLINFILAFGSGYGIYVFFKGDVSFLGNWRFWLLFSVVITVFAFRMSATTVYVNHIIERYANTQFSDFWIRIHMIFARRAPAIFGSALLIWLIKDRKKMPLYGFTRKGFDLRPYIGMLLFMVPLIFIAASTSDFLNYYPRAMSWGLNELSIHEPAHRSYFALFELAYGLDFINVELFFRGILILAFMEYAGAKAILPASMFYVVIHLGKPLGETISSFFGGTLLGIIAYYSKSILGGIIVHMGIAWLMELMAFLFLMLI